MTDTRTSALAYYARHGAALFPIPAGQKNPTGIVASFASDCSHNPAQWAAWQSANPGCNFGLVAGPSRLIIVDTDSKDDRDAAWAARCALFAEWGVDPAAMPHVQSARGGWHDLFAVPADVDAAMLRQPDAVKKIINVRAGNGFVVAAGSFYDGTAKGEASGPYVLLHDGAPHVAPAALITHCMRVARGTAAATGSRDIGDVAKLITWLAERGAFADYESWVGVGMALKLEFGDAGLDVWNLTHDETVTPDVIETKWHSFASEPAPGVQTLNSWLKRAHVLGWKGTIRESAAAMFGSVALSAVAQLAASTGATLPGAATGVPMMEGQAELTRQAEPMLATFLSTTSDAPTRPLTFDYPQIPDACSGHGLYNQLRATVERVVAMAEQPKSWKGTRVIDPLAVLACVHVDTYESLCRKLRAMGVNVPESAVKQKANALGEKVQRVFIKNDEWHTDAKGFPESDNSDNVLVLLSKLDAEMRWNGWLERAEIRGGLDVTLRGIEWPEWTYVDDTVVAKLLTRARRTGTRFRPGKDFLWETLAAIAHQNTHDPVLDRIAALEAAWDGVPRLSTWLSAVCGVDCDPYHQAVSRNIVGGIVRRARNPGCKFDTMAVLFGPQGTGKSTIAAILADMGQSTLTAIFVSSGLWFTDNILLGDASKELVLSLAGKTVAEIGEMGTRGSTNASHVKAMLSRQVDEGRTAYARAVSSRGRRNIFIGTTNDDEPLSDPSGNRRFLPVKVDREINLVWLSANVAQLVGEAAARDTKGESFDLPRSVWADAAARQEAARSESDIETLVNHFYGATEHTGAVSYILPDDLMHLSELSGWKTNAASNSRNVALRRLGFRNVLANVNGKRTRIWVRGGEAWLPSNITTRGTRYVTKADNTGRAQVIMRAAGGVAESPALPGGV